MQNCFISRFAKLIEDDLIQRQFFTSEIFVFTPFLALVFILNIVNLCFPNSTFISLIMRTYLDFLFLAIIIILAFNVKRFLFCDLRTLRYKPFESEENI